jgi:hypothetical protein
MRRKIITALGVIILSGCASTDQNNVYHAENHIKTKNELFATFKKDTNGNFRFNKFSFSPMTNSINLNTLVHNYPTNESECRKGIGEDGESGLCAEGAQFSTSTIDSGDVVKNTLGNAFAVVVTLGLRTSAYYTAQFDHESFNKALDEALSKIDRNTLILEANNIVLKQQGTLTQASSKFNNLQLNINKQVNKSVKVFDDSHFYSSQPQVKARVNKRFITSLKLNNVWTTTKELNNELTEQVEISASYGEISLKCDGISDFNFKVVGCQQSWGYSSALAIKPITYSISSAKKYTLYPVIKVMDENLTINSTNSGQIEIINNTNSFITLSSLSFYFGKNIETLSNLGLELPPGAVSQKLNMNEFKTYSNDRTLYSIVKKDLNKKIAIGVATKYKIIDTNVEKTIYIKNNYKYSDLEGYVG